MRRIEVHYQVLIQALCSKLQLQEEKNVVNKVFLRRKDDSCVVAAVAPVNYFIRRLSANTIIVQLGVRQGLGVEQGIPVVA